MNKLLATAIGVITLALPLLANADTSADKTLDLAALCNASAVQAVASGLRDKVTVAALPANHMPGPILPGGTRYVPAAKGLPAYCQVTGSFVTHPETGKTANFLATLPANWNGKYLQIGCGGHCGTFAVSDPATPFITITTQGKPGDIISKGYAIFATDEGHVGVGAGKWAIKESGEVDQDAIDDLLYRSHKVLATMGKQFTEAFYAQAAPAAVKISRSYFAGCSGGGRDTLVAASYFPEQFDGFISGSPYANLATTALQTTGLSLAGLRSPDADVSPELIALVDPIVKAKCDAIDGVEDGLIQNPMACDFRPEVDLPRCEDDKADTDCFTQAQIETLSTVLTAVTDEHGKVVQPGYSVSELQGAFRFAQAPKDLSTPDLWPDNGPTPGAPGGMAILGNAALKVLAHGNDPDFQTRSVLSFAKGGTGPVTGYRVIVPRKEVDFAEDRLRMGTGIIPENAGKMLELDRKLLIWSNLGDPLLTPYMAINYYKQLANLHGGYDKLQRNARLFALPGTAHCSGGLLVGPGSFDAIDAMEQWVEQGKAPNNLMATQYPATPFGADFSKPSLRTMPLCQFPQMARYSGKGDVNDGANWSCPEGDTSLLKIGESGRQAGVVE